MADNVGHWGRPLTFSDLSGNSKSKAIGVSGRYSLSSCLKDEEIPDKDNRIRFFKEPISASEAHLIEADFDASFASAVAIRRACEMRYDVDGPPVTSTIVLWRDDYLQVLSVECPKEGSGSEDLRVQRLTTPRSDPIDCQYLPLSHPVGNRQTKDTIHLQPSPGRVDLRTGLAGPDDTSNEPDITVLPVEREDQCSSLIEEDEGGDSYPRQSGSVDDGTARINVSPSAASPPRKWRMTFIEFCCYPDSKLCHEKYAGHGIRLVRLTLDHDVTTNEGLRYALQYIEDPNSGHVVMMGSAPCTFGCSWHRVTASRKEMDNPDTKAAFDAKLAKHKEEYTKIMAALMILLKAIKRVGGDYIHEWGAANSLWKEESAVEMIEFMELSRVYFDGCAVNLRATSGSRKGDLIQKPWAFRTTIPEIIREFGKLKCSCPRVKGFHARCSAQNASDSARYTWEMTDLIHKCLLERLWWVEAGRPANATPATGGAARVDDGSQATPSEFHMSASKCPQCHCIATDSDDDLSVCDPEGTEFIVDQDVTTIRTRSSADDGTHCAGDRFPFVMGTDSSSWVCTWANNQDQLTKASPISYSVSIDGNVKVNANLPIRVDVQHEAQCIANAAAAGPGGLEALRVTMKWILDTGCGQDLVGISAALAFRSYLKRVTPYPFATANGTSSADKVLPITVAAFDHATAEPYVMQDSPAVLSVGMRVMHQGYCFIWLTGMYPCMILPNKKIIPLDIDGDIPYYKLGGIYDTYGENCDTAALCGVEIDDRGNLVITSQFLENFFNPQPSCAMPAAGDFPTDDNAPGAESSSSHPSAPSSGEAVERRGDDHASDNDTPAPRPSRAKTKGLKKTYGDIKFSVKHGKILRSSVDHGADHAVSSDVASTDVPDEESDWTVSEFDETTEDEAQRNVRTSLLQDMKDHESVRHRLNHKPALSHNCEACMRGKTRHLRKKKNQQHRKPVNHGDIWTMDHVHMRDWWGQSGVGGFGDFLSVKDEATKVKYMVPVDSKDTLTTYNVLNTLRGDDTVKRVYSDNFGSLRKACHELGVMWEPSQPHMHETNAIIERASSDILAGLRTALVEAGHPACFWSYAGPCYCHHENITYNEELGASPWFLRHGSEFPGMAIPYGAGVYFKPEKHVPPKAAPRMSYGVFLGYRLAPGGKWNGEYLVADLDDFVGKDLSVDANGKQYAHFCPHITKVVKYGKEGIIFPCKAKYDRVNCTLDGLEEAYRMFHPLSTGSVDDDTDPEDNVGDELRGEQGQREENFEERIPGSEHEDQPPASSSDTVAPDPDALPRVDAPPDTHGQYGYHVDSAGREYPLDAYGSRIYRNSSRPPYIPSDTWNYGMTAKQKREAIADYKKAGFVAPPAAAAVQAAWEDKYSKQWHRMDEYVKEFDDRWGWDPLGVTSENPTSVECDMPTDDASADVSTQRRGRNRRRGRARNWSRSKGTPPRGYDADDEDIIPAMPCVPPDHTHRPKTQWLPPLFPACVAEPVSRKDIEKYPKAIEARKKESNNLKEKGVWDEATVREWLDVAAEARRTNTEIHIGRVFGIMVVKNAELPMGDERRKFKYRLVFSGDRVVNQHWEAAVFAALGSDPASMDAGKAVDAFGCFPGNSAQQADAEQAYIQADLKGPPTWVLLPEELWPADWYHDGEGRSQPKYHRPVVRLKEALYGHPDAGKYWELHCDACLREVGFQPIDSWSSCYHHKKLNLFLSVYVDDMKLSGPEGNLDRGWDLIRKFIRLEKPTPLQLYLGCMHEEIKVPLPDGTVARGISYNMEQYLRAALDKYFKLVEKMGRPVKFKEAWTPDLPEDQKTSPQGAPVSTGPCVKCPWCQHAFPHPSVDDGAKNDKGKDASADLGTQSPAGATKKSPENTAPDENGHSGGEGKLGELASSVLMKVFYAARMARYDLQGPIGRLSRYINK